MGFFQKINFRNVFLNKNISKLAPHKGFTLAEVLITLGIIGVVAAITIPHLLNNADDQKLKVKWKKQYTSLNQIFMLLATENGGNLAYAFDDGNGAFDRADRDLLRDAVLSKMYFSAAKKCTALDAPTGYPDGCFHTGTDINKISTGKYNDAWMYTHSRAEMSDGMLLDFDMSVAGLSCSASAGSDGTSNGNGCAIVYVDVNGWDKPNTFGRDIYCLHVLKSGQTAACGAVITGETCDRISSAGLGCSAKVILNEDY